jgi:hypothetical protein
VFSRKKDNFTAIKLYSIDDEQANIHRPTLIHSLLEFFESELNCVPKCFDIHGPYGIPKGQTVGIRSFKNKLDNRGHDDYFGLHGISESKLGFHVLFNAPIGNNFYTELIIWCNKSFMDLELRLHAKKLLKMFPISSGFEMEFDDQYSIYFENKTKRGWFGSVENRINYKHLEWIKGFSNGKIRQGFKSHLLSQKQFNLVQLDKTDIKYSKLHDLYLVESVI